MHPQNWTSVKIVCLALFGIVFQVLCETHSDVVEQETSERKLRWRRQAGQQSQVFVVPQKATGIQFNVAIAVSPNPLQQFQFVSPVPANLTLSSQGTVSLIQGTAWNNVTFGVNVTVNGTSIQTFSVTLYVVNRNTYDPIFTNQPSILWTTCPVWIRPGTVIFQVQSIDKMLLSAVVNYQLESGGEGKFGIDPSSGNVFIVGRQMYEINKVYNLSISAPIVGMLPTIPTPSQVLHVKIGYLNPQFYTPVFNVSFYENTTAGGFVYQIQARSFQNLLLTYSMISTDGFSGGSFNLDSSSGIITLQNPMIYIQSTHRQFRFNVTVTESFSQFPTMTSLLINLVAINHPPIFLVSHYVKTNLAENVALGTSVVDVIAYDYDPGAFGQLTYSVTDNHFMVVTNTNGALPYIQTNRALDYDYLPGHRYQFSVVATDGGGLLSSATVQVWLQNMNDQFPVFEPVYQQVIVKEGFQQGLALMYIQAYDPDGDGITFNFNPVNGQNQNFSVNQNTGLITLLTPIIPGNNNSVSIFNLSVSITDNGSCCPWVQPTLTHTTQGTVGVMIQRINTQPTFPQCQSYNASVMENLPANTPVLNMTAVHIDYGLNVQLNFTIFGDDRTYFGVRSDPLNPKVAQLFTLMPFNRETPPSSSLKFNNTIKVPVTVKVQDNGQPPLSTNCFLFVTILDANDNPPVFDYSLYQTSLSSTTSGGARVVRVFATDQDVGSNAWITYSFDSSSATSCTNTFNIDPNLGWITFQGTTNLATSSSFNCVVRASNTAGNPPLSATAPVSITIVSAPSDILPNWQTYPGTNTQIDDYAGLYILENVTSNYLVTTLSAVRPNGQTPCYYIPSTGFPMLNGGSQPTFGMSPQTCQTSMTILDLLPLDSSAIWIYFLRCRAFNSITQSTAGVANIARLQVNIKDVNNKIPMFLGMDSNGIYPGSVTTYTKVGDPVIYVTAVDLDREWPNNQILYSLPSNAMLCPDCLSFSIDQNSGLISAAVANFNPNIQPSYLLTVVASDGTQSAILGMTGPNTAQVNVAIRVIGATTNSPFFTQNFSASVTEGSPYNTTVLTASASINSTTNSFGGPPPLTQYGIQSGNNNRRFAVDLNTGRVYVVGDIYYPTQTSYSLGLRVFDGAVINTTYISISVQESTLYYPPIFNPTVYNNINQLTENDPSSIGAVITTVTANDSEQLTFTYSIEQPNNFAIGPNSGIVTLVKPLSRDYPNGYSTWQVNVIAMDTLGSMGYGLVNLVLIDNNNNPPTFDGCCISATVIETASSGTPVLQLYARDPDFGINGTLTFSLSPGNSPNLPFQVSSSGMITTNGGLVYFTQNSYTFNVRAIDGRNLFVDQSVTILVAQANIYPPVFVAPKMFTATIPEKMTIGSSVLVMTATDPDIGPNSMLTYSISEPDSNSFYADSIFVAATGILRIAQIINYDLTKKSTYQFSTTVQDPNPSHSDTALIIVTVYDINDNPPVFSTTTQTVNISEANPVNSYVATFSATDADSAFNGMFSYFIDYRNTDPKFNFRVNSSSGVVTVRNILDVEITSFYQINILAVDDGQPPLTGTATLTVNVLNANTHAPTLQILQQNLPQYVPAATQKGTPVVCFQAVDPDETSSNPTLTCNYNSCTDPHCADFNLQQSTTSNSWCLVANRNGYSRTSLGYSSYNLTVQLSDGTNAANRPIFLVIESTDDYAPKNGQKSSTVYNYVGINGAFGKINVGNVYVVTSDAWNVSPKTFMPVSPWDQYFYLDNSGNLWMYGNATAGVHTLNVQVIDSKFPNTVAMGTMTVNVRFINDSAVQSPGSLRMTGMSSSDFLTIGSSGSNGYLQLQQQLATLLNTQLQYVDIFSIVDVVGAYKTVDVVYSAHGSPYYTPEKMNSAVWNGRSTIQQNTGLSVMMSPVDLCRVEFQNCWDIGCATVPVINSNPGLINTNQTSFAGPSVTFTQSCICPSTSSSSASSSSSSCDAYSCFNNGTCILNGSTTTCICPVGYNGPRCQQTKISFTGSNSYIYLMPLESCEIDHLSVDLMTQASNVLVLYNGPMTDADVTAISQDFISIELVGGRPKLRINLGEGELMLPPASIASWPTINDGNWHTLEVFHDGQLISFVVDHCSNAPPTENIQNSTQDRSGCESNGTAPQENFLLSVATPLQLGGRSNIGMNFPKNLQTTSYNGCIKNLRHNGLLYDLSIGLIRTSNGTSEGCSQEQCSSCPANSTCIGSMSASSAAQQCICPPGFTGAQCQTSATVQNFDSPGSSASYANWTLTPFFTSSINSSSQYDASLQTMFRTRTQNGILLWAESFSTLERNILEVVNNYVQFRYDLGSGDQNLSLPNVAVNDGAWHTVRVERHGNQVSLLLDNGDDDNFNTTFPVDAHRLLRVSHIFGPGEVRTNQWTGVTSVVIGSNPNNTCLQDIRYMNYPLPLASTDNNQIATVTMSGTSSGCISSACGLVSCGIGQYCYDTWWSYVCRCNDSTTVINNNGVCVPPLNCFSGLCQNGGTCVVINGFVSCVCLPPWFGTFCKLGGPPNNEESSNPGSNSNYLASIIVPIIFGILLLLLLILLLVFCLRRRRPEYLLNEPDEDASRENVLAYDEEGAGEEDINAFDLSRLQKPVDPDLDTMRNPYGDDSTLPRWNTLTGSAPDALSRRKQPGDYPSVGDFISDRLKDAEDDDKDNPDNIRIYDGEGTGSQAGSLSSLGSSSSGGQDFGYLNDLGPRFKKLADLYGDNEGTDEDERDVSNV